MSQNRAKKVYQFIYTDLVRLITLMGFEIKRYFFTFTDNHICITKTYTERQKSK